MNHQQPEDKRVGTFMWTSLMDKSPTRPQGLPEGPAACDLPTAIAHKKVQLGKSQSKTTRIFRKIYIS